jgi:hypothetical protein
MDDEHVLAFIEAVDRTDFDAIHELALDARFGNDIGHDEVPAMAESGFEERDFKIGIISDCAQQPFHCCTASSRVKMLVP